MNHRSSLLSSLAAAALYLPLCTGVATTARAQSTEIKSLKPTGDLAPLVDALEGARLYPVLILPLGSGYYDFELKASVNNYSSDQLVYFFASAVDRQPGLPVWDAAIKVFFTSSVLGDGRVWRPAVATQSIYSQLGGVTNTRLNHLVVIPSKITNSSVWMYPGNTHLVWSYVRISAVGPETDPSGRIVWNPIVPTAWRMAPIAP